MFDFFKKNKDFNLSEKVLSEIEQINKNLEKISLELEKIKKEEMLAIKKIGIVRFNPFKEMGGNQSFSVAFLDENDDGIVITSLFGSDGNRVYGKPIKNGTSEYPLTEEEKKSIESAKYGKRNTKNFYKTTSGGDNGAC